MPMKTLRYTLLTDGSSDIALQPIIEWIVAQHRPDIGVIGEIARDLGKIGLSLKVRIPHALKLFPCDILFIHRDAEAESMDFRIAEISDAIGEQKINWIPIIPVRMTEAWLLSDESAIRSAAENRSGRIALNLPQKRVWEGLNDPKRILFDALTVASEKSGRALSKFNPNRQRGLVAQRTTDFSSLRGLSSFDFFEAQLIAKLKDI